MSLIILYIIIKYIKEELKKEKLNSISYLICYALLLAGATGNLLDRLIFGYVIDFLDFYIFTYHFPIFNIADSMIVIATFILLYKTLKESRG